MKKNIKNKKRSSWIRRSKRFSIYTRDEFKCVWCMNKIEDAHITLDHIIPFSVKPNNRPSNLITACRSCNSKRRNLSIEEFANIMSKLIRQKPSTIIKRIKYQANKELPIIEF